MPKQRRQCRQRKHPTVLPHQLVESRRIGKTADESIEFAPIFADQNNAGVIFEHEFVVQPQKSGAHSGEEEFAESSLVNLDYAGKIRWRCTSNYRGATGN